MRFRVPLKSLLRDLVMMVCGSLIGLYLAKGFSSPRDLLLSDIAHLCSAVHITKRGESVRPPALSLPPPPPAVEVRSGDGEIDRASGGVASGAHGGVTLGGGDDGDGHIEVMAEDSGSGGFLPEKGEQEGRGRYVPIVTGSNKLISGVATWYRYPRC